MNARLLAHLGGALELYPHALERDYPAVLERIVALWGTDEGEEYLAQLIVADHERRQGFPPDVAREIVKLSLFHDQWRNRKQEKEEDPWAAEPMMDEPEREAFLADLARRGEAFASAGLFRRVEEGDTGGALLFLRAGMDVDVRRADQWTPLMVALFSGREETALMLLARGANVRARDEHGYEPLHWAALQGYERATRFILGKGADPNAMTDYGFTPMLQAASRGHLGIIRLLVERGAVVNQAGYQGFTPLHKAAANGHAEVVRYLIERGADREARTADGATAAMLAARARRPDIVSLIKAGK
jgi:ankyrin repeat protein